MESVFKVMEASKEVGRIIRVHRYSPLFKEFINTSHLDYNLQLLTCLKFSDFERSHKTPLPTFIFFSGFSVDPGYQERLDSIF